MKDSQLKTEYHMFTFLIFLTDCLWCHYITDSSKSPIFVAKANATA